MPVYYIYICFVSWDREVDIYRLICSLLISCLYNTNMFWQIYLKFKKLLFKRKQKRKIKSKISKEQDLLVFMCITIKTINNGT